MHWAETCFTLRQWQHRCHFQEFRYFATMGCGYLRSPMPELSPALMQRRRRPSCAAPEQLLVEGLWLERPWGGWRPHMPYPFVMALVIVDVRFSLVLDFPLDKR